MNIKELKEAIKMFQDDDEVYIVIDGDRVDIARYTRTEYYGAGDSMDLLTKKEAEMHLKVNGGFHP